MLKLNTYCGNITSLEDNEVFCFGSNLSGFHGAGSAGFASFGEAGNVWRKHNYLDKPWGWKGKWNIKGRGKGFQEGTEGKSYAIPTVIKAGAKQSISLDDIKKSVKELYDFADEHKDLKFYIAYSGHGRNLNGYSTVEMGYAFYSEHIPDNVYFEESFVEFVSDV
jgi:hypothetical protein